MLIFSAKNEKMGVLKRFIGGVCTAAVALSAFSAYARQIPLGGIQNIYAETQATEGGALYTALPTYLTPGNSGSALPDDSKAPGNTALPIENKVTEIDCTRSKNERITASLDGVWLTGLYEGAFFHAYDGDAVLADKPAPVPGIIDEKDISAAGLEPETLCAVYKRAFVIDGMSDEDIAVLELLGARYSRRVFVNGEFAGSYNYDYSASRFDVTRFLRDGENEIVILLGGISESDIPAAGANPGITDSVNLIITGGAFIGNIKSAPSVEDGTVLITAEIENFTSEELTETVNFTVYELGIVEDGVSSVHTGCGFLSSDVTVLPGEKKSAAQVNIKIRDFSMEKCWSPENPYLYEIEVRTGSDTKRLRVGIRELTADGEKNDTLLNGSRIFFTGTVLDFNKLSADSSNVWNAAWVKSLFREFKKINWIAVKSSQGMLPSVWYDAADELGLLLIAEYPLGGVPNDDAEKEIKASSVLEEIYIIMDELYNHPSVIIWDISGENGVSGISTDIIRTARSYDIQNRPWNNGLSAPEGTNDLVECDVTAINKDFNISELGSSDFILRHTREELPWSIKDYNNGCVITNYGAFFELLPDGSPTEVSKSLWDKWLPGASDQERLDYRIETIAALTEYWRASRKYIGVMLPENVFASSIMYGDAGGGIKDDVSAVFASVFSPVGIAVEYYGQSGGRGDKLTFDVAVINDTAEDVSNISVTLVLYSRDNVLYSETKPYDTVKKLGTEGRDIVRREFNLTIPATVTDGTEVTIAAYFRLGDKTVVSERKLLVSGGAMYESPASQWIVAGGIGACVIIVGSASIIAFGRLRRNSVNAVRRRSMRKRPNNVK